jgi:solute carrier family 25 (mitochondrial adenine nucleotide translocator), member 4/5/6/31
MIYFSKKKNYKALKMQPEDYFYYTNLAVSTFIGALSTLASSPMNRM